jgi:hypothetical protein
MARRGFREMDDFGGVALTSPAHDIAQRNLPPNTHLEYLGPPVNAWVPVENGYYVDEQQNKVKGTDPKYAPKPPTVTTAPASPLATQTRPPAVLPNWWDQMWADFLRFFGVK